MMDLKFSQKTGANQKKDKKKDLKIEVPTKKNLI